MNIAMLASEAAPYVKTGGLGDVIQALPAELARQQGNRVCLFLPYYKRIKTDPRVETEFLGSFHIRLAWRESYVGIFRRKVCTDGVELYFIDNDYYFGARGAVYGEFDDGERFAYYSKAALAAMYFLDFKPDILHCHDWQAAAAVADYRAFYADWSPQTKTVFTIHNIEYQGWADAAFFDHTLGLPERFRQTMSFDGAVNLMKSAIALADVVTTVSRSYAEELRYPYFAHRLEYVLRDTWLCGITNGIDTNVFNPATDPALVCNYSAENPHGKAENKTALREELGLRQDTDAPILAMVSRLAGHKGIDLLCYNANRLAERDVQLVIVGTGERQYEYALGALAAQHPGKVAVCLRFDAQLASRVYAGADIYLMPSRSEPCGLSQLIAMHYGTIPVVSATGGLKDTVEPYDPTTGRGSGFTFQSYNADDFLGAIDRATGLYYGDRAAWRRLIGHDMLLDVSWRKPAAEYMRLYVQLLQR